MMKKTLQTNEGQQGLQESLCGSYSLGQVHPNKTRPKHHDFFAAFPQLKSRLIFGSLSFAFLSQLLTQQHSTLFKTL